MVDKKRLKVLNLYCGIGGNRKLWTDCEVTAVEMNLEIAAIYQDFFPNDKVVIGDAHQYLLDHYKEFDFIWSSPPCPTHSTIRQCGVYRGQYPAKFPDMQLYEEIILLQYFAHKETKWVVENVKPYYKPLIPAKELHRHLFWTNFPVTYRDVPDDRIHSDIKGNSEVYGFSLEGYKNKDKKKLLRNMVNPELGLFIFNEAQGVKTKVFDQPSLL